MAYYNPESQNPYYDPDDIPQIAEPAIQPEPAPEPPNAKGVLGSLIGGLVVFGVGTSLVRGGFSAFLNKGTKALSNLAKTNIKQIRSKTLQSVARSFRPATSFAERVVKKSANETVTLGNIIREVPVLKDVYKNYNKLVQAPREAYSKYLSTVNATEHVLRKHGSFNQLQFQKTKLKYFWDKQNRAKRITGAVEKAGLEYVKSLPAFYAVDRVVNAEEYAGKKPSILNLPGTALDFAKFGVEWLPQDILFGAAFKGLGLAGLGVSSAVAKKFKTLGVDRHLDKIAAKVHDSKILGKIKDIGYRTKAAFPILSEINHDIAQRFKSNFVGRKENRVIYKRKNLDLEYLSKERQRRFSQWKTNYRNIKRRASSSQNLKVQLKGERKSAEFSVHRKDKQLIHLSNLVQRTHDAQKDIAGNVMPHKISLGSFGSSFRKDLRAPKLSWAGQITNREFARRGESGYRNTYEKFFNFIRKEMGHIDSEELKLVENSFYKSTYGQGVFKSSVNPSAIADYSHFSPVNILKVAPNLLSKIGFRVPFTKTRVRPFDWIAGQTLFGQGARTRVFGKEENYYVGPKRDTRSFLNKESNKSFMAFSGNQFHVYDPGAKTFTVPEELKNKRFWLRSKNTRLQELQARENAYHQNKFKDIIDKPYRFDKKTFRGKLERFSRTQELGAGFGKTKSFYSRVMGWASKQLHGARPDIDKAYSNLLDKNLFEDINSGFFNIAQGQHPTQVLKGALEDVRKNAAVSLLDHRVWRRLGERTKIRRKVGNRMLNISNILEDEKSLTDFWRENITTAPNKVKNIIERHDLGEKKVLDTISSVPSFGKALTGKEELQFEALERMLLESIKGTDNPVFGVKAEEFIKDLSKETGISKLALSAVNNFGLNIELKNLYSRFSMDNVKTAKAMDTKEFLGKFISKIKTFENRELIKLNTYLSDMTGTRKADDRLLGINKIINQQIGNTPYLAIEQNLPGVAGNFFKYTLERLADMGGLFGLGMDQSRYAGLGGGPGKGITGYWTKRGLQAAAIFGGYNILDTFFDANPMFNHTMLDEGISVAIAEQFVKARLATAKVGDLAGITKGAQYAEGLMPGSTTFIPGTVIGGITGGPIGAVLGGFANRMISTYFDHDLTRDYEELKDVYAGRQKLPVRKGRFWELSKTRYEGERISYYSPNWFHLLKSQYKQNPVLYGGKLESLMLTKPWPVIGFNPVGLLLDPYRLERKQYFQRPYPYTSSAGEDIPLVGPLVSSTIGKIIKPVKQMHSRELDHTYNGIPGGAWDESLRANLLARRATDLNASSAIALRGGFQKPISPYDMYSTLGEQVYNMTEVAGLLGFGLENTILRGGIGEARAKLESASRMSSIKRQYWDAELGGGIFTTEFWRRFVPRDRQEIEYRNPIKNLMPNWLPGNGSDYFLNFQTGDPYTKVPKGEARLPGFGLESLRNVKYTFPGRASMIGKDVPTMVSWMLGVGQEKTLDEQEIMETGTTMHRAIQDNLRHANLLIKEEATLFDPINDISGHIDAIVKDGLGGGGKRALEIKTISAKGFDTLVAPRKQHRSQLNFYLSQLNMPAGNLLYVNRDDPSQVKSFNVYFSKDLLQRDISKLHEARQIAGNLLENGVRGQNIGEAYSHLDRLEILGDVAPWSKEYKEELKIVNAQKRAGLLTPYENKKINTIRQHRANVVRRFDFYPRRFGLDQLMDPDPTYTQLNINENIKAAADYTLPERALGGLWESFTHADLPFVNKFFGHKSPIEHYKERVLYGTAKSFWQKPYESFIEPSIRGMLGQEDVFGGATKFAVPGFLLGGPVGALGMGAFGALYGGARSITGGTYIPGIVSKQREIGNYFDYLEYEKNKRLHDLTGEQDYFDNMQRTMTGYKAGVGKSGIRNLFRAVNRPERDYLSAFLKTSNPVERNEILRLIPGDLSDILKGYWNKDDNINRSHQYSEEQFRSRNVPDPSWPGWSPHLPIEDYQVQTMKKEGLDAHDVGLGWSEQERRIRNSPWKIEPININRQPQEVPTASRNQLEFAIQSVLKNWKLFGNVSVIPIGNDYQNINLTINGTVDRRKDMLRAIRGF